MRILVLTGALLPFASNNANLLLKILPYISKKHDIRLLSIELFENTNSFPKEYFGYPVYWTDKSKESLLSRKIVFPIISKLLDTHGYSDVLNVLYVRNTISEIYKTYHFDAIISTFEPFPSVVVSSKFKVKKILYLMDPPEYLSGQHITKYRKKRLSHILKRQNCILTTPFIENALKRDTITEPRIKIERVGFPMITDSFQYPLKNADEKVHLLFCGWMCSELRSPKYFLDLVANLNEKYVITFMGRDCESLFKIFPIKTRAKIILYPQQPYEVALQAMANADILINIGNSVPVHVPSKTLEYINTGKPIVNFYKFENCPTLYYTKRYPLALNLYEGNDHIDEVTDQFMEFCANTKGKQVDRSFVLEEFKDCTPEYIAELICNNIKG